MCFHNDKLSFVFVIFLEQDQVSIFVLLTFIPNNLILNSAIHLYILFSRIFKGNFVIPLLYSPIQAKFKISIRTQLAKFLS